MEILVGILLLIIFTIIYMYFEASWIKVANINFAKSSKGLKVVHLSDIHTGMLRVDTGKVKKIIRKTNPDVILITGDYVEKPIEVSAFLDFLQAIKQVGKTFICLGNHDYKAFSGNETALQGFINEIKALQVEVLINRSVQIEKNSFTYSLIGVDDLREGNPDIEAALVGCPLASRKVVFSHNPDLVLQMNRNHADYFFCGHFHGGQIWAPFNLEFLLLRKDKLCKMGIRRGLHKVNGINVYINRGLGNVLVPLRFLSRPEISVYIIP